MNRLNLARNEIRDDSFLRRHYGPNAVITRLGKVTLIHLDNPSSSAIKKRIKEVTREEITGEAWDECCSLCQMAKDEPCDIIYPSK